MLQLKAEECVSACVEAVHCTPTGRWFTVSLSCVCQRAGNHRREDTTLFLERHHMSFVSPLSLRLPQRRDEGTKPRETTKSFSTLHCKS